MNTSTPDALEPSENNSATQQRPSSTVTQPPSEAGSNLPQQSSQPTPPTQYAEVQLPAPDFDDEGVDMGEGRLSTGGMEHAGIETMINQSGARVLKTPLMRKDIQLREEGIS
jgi:hypothetical protein